MLSLGDRMKGYENNSNYTLSNFLPIIIRIDGKKFSSFTRGMKKPFDEIIMNSMWETTKYLCENIQNAKIGYTQSDEISILLMQNNLENQMLFNNRIQKIVSVSSSMATMAFNKIFRIAVENNNETYKKKIDKAMFDARIFSLPDFEVNNYFLWRQKDAEKNSKSSICQSLYSQKELMNKNGKDQMELMFKKGINWNDLKTFNKRGICVIKDIDIENTIKRNIWIIDKDIPIFSENPDYINKYLIRNF